jgi:hypothetical protein
VLLLPNFQRTFNYIKFSLPLFSPHLLVIYFVIFAPASSLSFFSTLLFDRGAKVRVSSYSPNLFSLILFLFFFILRAICSDYLRFIYTHLRLYHCSFVGGAKVSVSFILQNLSHFFSFFFSPRSSRFLLLLQISILRASILLPVCLFYEQVSI